jgi:hypothetical protein
MLSRVGLAQSSALFLRFGIKIQSSHIVIKVLFGFLKYFYLIHQICQLSALQLLP